MKNRKGFTLVELLVTISVMAIIMGISIPLIRGIQARLSNRKYDTYKDSLTSSAKLYVDSYWEDLFGKQETGCAIIKYSDLKDKRLIKDTKIDELSCDSDETFVKVIKNKKKYSYVTYLGCGKKDENGLVNVSLLEPSNRDDVDTCVIEDDDMTTEKYKLSFDDNGGNNCSGNPIKNRLKGRPWGGLCNPKRSGYVFTEWNTKRDGTGSTITSSSIANSDLKVYAQWRRPRVTVRLNANGGVMAANHGSAYSIDGDGTVLKNGSKNIHVVEYGNSFGVYGLTDYDNSTALNIKKVGYHTDVGSEWNTKADGSGKNFDEKESEYTTDDFCDASKKDCSVTLYVNWKSGADVFKVTLNKNDGTNTTSTLYERYNRGWYSDEDTVNKVDKVDVPTWIGRTFQGYYTQASGGVKVINADGSFASTTAFNQNGNLYARWRYNVLTIKHKVNSGETIKNTGAGFTSRNGWLYLNNSLYTKVLNYGESLGEDGLLNWNNSDHMQYVKANKNAEDNATYKDQYGNTFSDRTNYRAENMCSSLKNGDCTLELSVNWRKARVYFKYLPNGGTWADGGHGSSYTFANNDDRTILRDGSDKFDYADYDGYVGTDGLYNVNNKDHINLKRSGYKIDWGSGKIWYYYKPNDSTKYYVDQDTNYQVSIFACSTAEGDCSHNFRVNWVRN